MLASPWMPEEELLELMKEEEESSWDRQDLEGDPQTFNSCKFAEWQNIIKQAIRVGIHVSSIYNNHSFSIMCTIWLDFSFVYPKATPVMKFLAWPRKK